MDGKVHIGLIGCGQFGRCHLQTLRSIPHAKVTAVFDTDAKRGKQLAAEFRIPRVCRTLDEICSLDELHAIDVVTPENSHLEAVLKAVSAGKHVFVEKPLATNLNHCSRMIEAARKARRILMVGHILRFETKCAMLKEEVNSGRLGRIVSMHARRNRSRSFWATYGRTHPAIENSIHDIDLMLWYSGKAVKRARGYGRSTDKGRNPNVFWGVLEFEGGAIGVVETIWLIPEATGILLDDAFQLVGTKGTGNLQLFPSSLTFWREEGFFTPNPYYPMEISHVISGPLHDELTYFCNCVLENRPPRAITPMDAKRAVRVAMALVESQKTGRDIKISEWD